MNSFGFSTHDIRMIDQHLYVVSLFETIKCFLLTGTHLIIQLILENTQGYKITSLCDSETKEARPIKMFSTLGRQTTLMRQTERKRDNLIKSRYHFRSNTVCSGSVFDLQGYGVQNIQNKLAFNKCDFLLEVQLYKHIERGRISTFILHVELSNKTISSHSLQNQIFLGTIVYEVIFILVREDGSPLKASKGFIFLKVICQI